MNKKEIKEILANKFKDENCGFTKKDIKIKDIKDGFEITIADYDHAPYRVTYFEGEWWAYDSFFEEYVGISSKLENCLLYVGYDIANKF